MKDFESICVPVTLGPPDTPEPVATRGYKPVPKTSIASVPKTRART